MGRLGGTATVSLVLHALALVGLVAWSVREAGAPDDGELPVVFYQPPPPPPPPPPLKVSARPRDPSPTPSEPQPTLVEPTVVEPVPTPVEPSPAAQEAGVESGVEGGAAGGTEGGTVGGVLGGVVAGEVGSETPVMLKKGMIPPRVVPSSAVQPVYPRGLRDAQIAGAVLLLIEVRRDGGVGEVKVSRGHPELAAAAVAAVKQWRFLPATFEGKALAVWLPYPFVFRLED